MAEKTGTDAPRRLKFGQRTSSSSDSLSKLKTNTFTRRRTAPDLFTPTLASSAFEPQQEQPQPEQAQRQPRQMTPGRIPRSSSFFQSLNTFVSRDATANNNKESNNTELRAFRQPRKITHRFSQPPSFFNQSQQDDIEPLISKSKSKTHITQRALMQPILNPPLPRRSTMGNLTQKPSPQTPNFMRPTSSSAARQNSARAVSTNYALKKTATPNKPRSRPSGQIHPPTNFSLPSSSRLPKVTVQEGTTPPNSPKFGLSQTVQPGQSEQSERPKLGINSNLTFEELLRTITPEEELNVVSKEPPATEEASDEPAASESNSVPEYLQITAARPNGYWAGRVTAISDRFRTEALESSSPHDSDMHDDTLRLRRVFVYLRSLCTTKEAIDSLEAFQRMWAMREQGGSAAAHQVFGGSSGGKKIKEKRGVFEKLTGRKK